MTLEFQLSLQLVKEDDGQMTLLAATVTPSHAFRAVEPVVGVPAGVAVPANACPVILPLVQAGSPSIPMPAVVHHTLSDLKLTAEQTEITAFTTLGGVVVASRTVNRASATSADFHVTVEATALKPSDTIDPNQTQLTIVQAGIIVQEAVPGPDLPFSTKLENAIGVSPDRLAAFQEAVFQGVRDRKFGMKKADIPKSGSSKLSDVRATVQEKARRDV